MGCLFGCFRADSGGGGRAAHAKLVSSPVVPAAEPKVGERRKPPSKNALSAVFLREDEGLRVEQAASSGTNETAERKRMDQEFDQEASLLKNCGSPLQTSNEIINGPEHTHQSAPHWAGLPALSDELQFMEGLKVEHCHTPPGSHQSSILPDALSSSWKGCDTSSQHDFEAVSKSEDVNNESVMDCGIKLTTLDSFSFVSKDDICLVGSKSSPFSTPSKMSDEVPTPVTTHAINLEEQRNKGSRACAQHVFQNLSPVENSEKCAVSREDSCQPDVSDQDFKCANYGSLVSVELSISNECSMFQSSEGSVSSCNKTIDNMNTPSVDKGLTTEAIVHTSRKKVLKNNDSDVEFPSLSQWLKPPNPKNAFRDEAFTSDRSHSAKSSEEDRPIIGMVAAHWKDKEPGNFTTKWWDGNGIPNSTNKYKEDQKVSWHATSFEERLEKALSDEKLLSQRKCSSGNTSQFSGMEGEESDTAASNRLYVSALT